MDASQFFGSNYLSPADLNGKNVVATVLNIKQTEFNSRDRGRERKLVVFFAEVDRGVVLNKTGFAALSKAYGNETSGWEGKKVTLIPDQIEIEDKKTKEIKMVDYIRLHVDESDYVPPENWPKPTPPSRDDDLGDEVPF